MGSRLDISGQGRKLGLEGLGGVARRNPGEEGVLVGPGEVEADSAGSGERRRAHVVEMVGMLVKGLGSQDVGEERLMVLLRSSSRTRSLRTSGLLRLEMVGLHFLSVKMKVDGWGVGGRG